MPSIGLSPSYSPTVKALQYARQRASNDLIDTHKAVLVMMPKTPNYGPLPGTKSEINSLKASIPDTIAKSVLEIPTRDAVLAELRTCTIAHFACHGEFSYTDPSRSKLILEDWDAAPLTVEDLTALKLEKAQFAYLSACHSAGNRSVKLLDEGIHLTAAFQLAGFASVVGTLWRIKDIHASTFPRLVYSKIVEGEQFRLEKVAEAVHFSVRELREETRNVKNFSDKDCDDPCIWAAYVHFGI